MTLTQKNEKIREGNKSLSDLFSKSPPQNQEAEMAVLGAVILENSSFDDVAPILKETHFYNEKHRVIWRAICKMRGDEQKVDLVTLLEFFERHRVVHKVGGTAYVAGLPDHCPTHHNAVNYAKIIKDLAVIRELILTCNEVVYRAYDGVDNPEEFLEEAQGALFDLTQKNFDVDTDYSLSLNSAHQEFIKLSEKGVMGLSTGIGDLDQLCYGMSPGEVFVIAARPAGGKSMLALNIIENVLFYQGKNTLLFNFEMSAVETFKRFFTLLTGVTVQPNKPITKEEHTKLINVNNLFRKYRDKFFIDCNPTLTPANMRARARKIATRHSMGLIIVDYLQLIHNPMKGRNRENEVADASRQMKIMAKEINCPVVLLSQLNRSVGYDDSKEPKLHYLRESGAVEQDADKVLFIWQNAKDMTNYLTLAKHRNGPTGRIVVNVNWKTGRFVDKYTTPKYWEKEEGNG